MTQELLLIAGMALATFACRYPVLALVSRVALPEALLRAMRFLPPAILTAIILPAVLMPDGQRINFHYANSHLVAALVAGVIAWWTQHLLLTIVVSMGSFWLWRWAVGG
jgi:branched-subunit amino acid transport protein